MNSLMKTFVAACLSMAVLVCLTSCNGFHGEQGTQEEQESLLEQETQTEEETQEEQESRTEQVTPGEPESLTEQEAQTKEEFCTEEETQTEEEIRTEEETQGTQESQTELITLEEQETQNEPDTQVESDVCQKYTVTFTLNNGQSSITQEVEYGENVLSPDDPVRMGYKFLGWYFVDGENCEEWNFIGRGVTEDTTLVAKWDYATYELPIVNIDTAGEGIYSKDVYTAMTFSIENCDEELSGASGGIRLRGNSTMYYGKRPYRIKFDQKQSLFGLHAAKCWVLLADYLDPSTLHNYTALSLASDLDGLAFTSTPHKVNVYLNGEYVGLYTLCEQVQENEGRLGIEMETIDPEWTELKQFNFLIAMDASTPGDASAILDETYFYVEKHGKYFELKYPEKNQFASEAQFESFFNQLKTYTEEMLDAFAEGDIEKIKSEVNVNSLADYCIIDTIMGEHDHSWKSYNMYYTCTSDDPNENQKLNFGPVWDFDWCLNTEWTGVPNNQFFVSLGIYYLDSTAHPYYQIFNYNNKDNELYDLLKERYSLYASAVLGGYIDNLDALMDSMTESIALNHSYWYSSIDPDLSDKNLAFLKEYLIARKAQLDELWKIDLETDQENESETGI